MYHIYKKSTVGENEQYTHLRDTHLFGCNVGLIPKMLAMQLSPTDSSPMKWYLSVPSKLNLMGEPDTTVVIDVKPRNTKPAYVSLYELIDVWGFSFPEWSPILLRMRGLLIDESPSKYKKQAFTVQVAEENEAIFSVLYLSGSIVKGKIVGKWLPPGASPTNATLLWPDVFDYFYQCKQDIIKNVRHHGA